MFVALGVMVVMGVALVALAVTTDDDADVVGDDPTTTAAEETTTTTERTTTTPTTAFDQGGATVVAVGADGRVMVLDAGSGEVDRVLLGGSQSTTQARTASPVPGRTRYEVVLAARSVQGPGSGLPGGHSQQRNDQQDARCTGAPSVFAITVEPARPHDQSVLLVRDGGGPSHLCKSARRRAR